jgi:TusA-related sulfurtransferase
MQKENIIPDYRLDMQGEPCPYPAVKTLEAMESLEKGEILEKLSGDALINRFIQEVEI